METPHTTSPLPTPRGGAAISSLRALCFPKAGTGGGSADDDSDANAGEEAGGRKRWGRRGRSGLGSASEEDEDAGDLSTPMGLEGTGLSGVGFSGEYDTEEI